MSRRILMIDGQVFQTPALHRGMGKYSDEFIYNLIQQNESQEQWSDIQVIISSRMDFTEARGALERWAEKVTFIELPLQPDLPGSKHVIDDNRAQINQYVQTVAGKDVVVDFLVLALFQKELCSVFPDAHPSCRRVLLMHDLIPYIFHDVYLKDVAIKREYLTKYSEFLRVDAFITVSKTVANDLSLYLGVDKDRVFYINGGSIQHGSGRKEIDVPKRFILMPTGNDVRKNNRRGILGFEKFNKKMGGKYHLVITSIFLPHEITELQALAPNVIFTGNIQGEQLNYLYENAAAVLFPSEDEGLGLPILEAVDRKKPIACSDIPVFREMSKKAFHFFDFLDTDDIAATLERAVNSTPDTTLYEKVQEEFSWPVVARRAMKAFESVLTPAAVQESLLVCAPSPASSELAGWLAQTHLAELGQLADVQALTTQDGSHGGGFTRQSILEYIYPFAQQEVFTSQVSTPVYFLDDSKASASIMCRALGQPGVVMLCSDDMSEVWREAVNQRFVSQARYELEQSIAADLNDPRMLGSIVRSQRAVIVFDEMLEKHLQHMYRSMKTASVVEAAHSPVTPVAYENVLPDKTIVSTHVPAENMRERELHRMLAQAKSIEVDGSEDWQTQVALKATSYGVAVKKPHIDLSSVSSHRQLAKQILKSVKKRRTVSS